MILGFAGAAQAFNPDAVAHDLEPAHIVNLLHPGLIMHKIGVLLDFSGDLGKIGPFLQFHIDIPPVLAKAHGDGDGDGIFNPGY